MADDDFGMLSSMQSPKKRKKHKKKNRSEMISLNDDFDTAWDSVPTPKPKDDPPSPEPTPPPAEDPSASDSADTSSPTSKSKDKDKDKDKDKKKKKKKNARTATGIPNDHVVKANHAAKATLGGVSSIYSADKTTHVIEYGIKHDEIRKQRDEVKRIKDKRRAEKAERERKEAEAKRKHAERVAAKNKLKGGKSIKDEVKTDNTIEYGMSEAVLKQREETKRIKEKRRREKELKEQKEREQREKAKLKSKTPTIGPVSIPKHTRGRSSTDFVVSSKVAAKRAEIKELKAKKRLEKKRNTVMSKSSQALPGLSEPKAMLNSKSHGHHGIGNGSNGHHPHHNLQSSFDGISVSTSKRDRRRQSARLSTADGTKSPDGKSKEEKIKERRKSSNFVDGVASKERAKTKRRISKIKNALAPEESIDFGEYERLKEENIEFKKQLKKSEFIKKKYDLLKNETEIFKQEVAELNEENESLRAELKALKRKYHQLLASRKEEEALLNSNQNQNETETEQIETEIVEVDTAKSKESSPVSDLEESTVTVVVNGGDQKEKEEEEENTSNSMKSAKSSKSTKSTKGKREKSENTDSDGDDENNENENQNHNDTKNDSDGDKSKSHQTGGTADAQSTNGKIEESDPVMNGHSKKEEADDDDQKQKEVVMNGDVTASNTEKDGATTNPQTENAVEEEEEEEEEEEKEWEQWEADQICDWVLTLDRKYRKYEKTLRKHLGEEEMHGSLLPYLVNSDWDRFGVKSKKHQNAILKHVGKLVGQQMGSE